MPYNFWALVFSLAVLADALTTLAALRAGAYESNALPRWMMNRMNKMIAITLSHGTLAATAWILDERISAFILIPLIALYGASSLNNIRVTIARKAL